MRHFLKDTSGATAVEYGLIAALIVIGALVGLIVLGNGNTNSYNKTAARVSEVM